ncbi:hypothetical protein DV736_g4437, partial [Chaetothyriales sp. CBS 134916]
MQARSPGFVPKSKLIVLDQLIDNERSLYRVRAGDRVHYLTILGAVFDQDTMGIPHLLIPQLPSFPDTEWTRMTISREANGTLKHTISSEPLPQVKFTFHSNLVDILSLRETARLRSGVHEVLYKGKPAIAKYSCFDWDFYRMHHENWAYDILHNDSDPDQGPIAPRVLGHLTENGRPIGLLLEKIEGRFASVKDLQECERTLRILHAEPLRLIHGDVNRFNFIVDANNTRVRLVDFEHAESYDEEKARRELESLPDELTEESGRGSVIRENGNSDNLASHWSAVAPSLQEQRLCRPLRRSPRLNRLPQLDEITPQAVEQRAVTTGEKRTLRHRPQSSTQAAVKSSEPDSRLTHVSHQRGQKRAREDHTSLHSAKRPRTSYSPPGPEDDSRENGDADPIDYWRQSGYRWPQRDWSKKSMDINPAMSHLLARKKSTGSLRRKRSESELGEQSSNTPSDQKSREAKSAPYRDARYKTLIATKGSFMGKDPLGINEACKSICRKLLESHQSVPEDTMFRDDLFDETCEAFRNKNEARVIRDISLLIILSAESLPDYAYLYFPFLTYEAKCGAAALDVADRQNAHSMTLAVRAVVELFRLVKREKELDREILAFSTSHDHRSVRIYGHYPVVEATKTTFYRHPIREFSFTELDGKDK